MASILSVQEGSGFSILSVQELTDSPNHLYPAVGNAAARGVAPNLRNGVRIQAAPGNAAAAGVAPSVHGLPQTANFVARLRSHTTGAALTGLTTVAMTAYQLATGYRLDFSDGLFKASPATPSMALAEVSAAYQPGLYAVTVTTQAWTGWINWEISYFDGSYTYSFTGQSYYVAGVSIDQWINANALTIAQFLGLK